MSPVAGASSTTSRKPNVPPPANMRRRAALIVTAPIVFGRLHIVPVLAAFLAHYPEIDVRLVLTDRVTHLMEEQIDVALRIGELPDSSFMATRVGSVRRVICASPAYLAAHGTPPNRPTSRGINASRSRCWRRGARGCSTARRAS